MFQWLCQPGTYWDPKPFWWLRNSWVATLSIRILQALRLVAWIAWTAISFVGTLIADVIFPLVQWIWALVMGFIQFYFSLLIGHIAVEILLFLPFLLLGLAWLWWLFWPEISCWLDKAWPIFRLFLDLAVTLVGVAFQVFNILVRLWNNFVPVLGFVVYFTADLLVQFYRGVATLIGEANVEILFDGLTEISLFLSEIAVNVATAFINISPTLLQVFATVVGGLLNTILEIAPVLLQINFVVFRILPFKIGPIADLVVKVVTFVKKTFFLSRSLLEVGAAGLSAAASISGAGRLASTAAEPRNDAHSDQQLLLWRTFGESAGRYWSADTARASSDYLSRINTWLLKNPPGTYSDYHVLQGGDLVHSYYAGSAPLRARRGAKRDAAGDAAEESPHERSPRLNAELPEEWHNNGSRHAGGAGHGARTQYPYEAGTLNGDQLYYLSAEERHRMETHHESFAERPLRDELHKRLPCRSTFCGGETQTVAHPMRTIAETHVRDRNLLSNLVPRDIRAHRKRAAHLSSALHSAQHTAHRGFSAWRDNKHHLYKHLGDAWQRWTGHRSFGAAAEQWLTRYDDPVDSMLAYTPVLSEFWPFRRILESHPAEEQAKYYGRWAAKRRVFVAEIDDEYTGAKRRVAHITLNEHNATADEQTTALHRAKRQQGLGAGGVSMKSGAGNQDMGDGGGQAVGSDELLLLAGFTGIGGGFALSPVALGAGGFVAGRVLEPALPVLRLLYKLNCYDSPRHPFCIPELPSQLMCVFRYFMRMIPRFLQVTLCGFEEECADLGFCIHKRPNVKPVVSIVKSRAFFISWCWLQNFFVWIGIALGLIFPALRFSFFVAETVVPVFGPLIFGTIRKLIPEPVSKQDSVCLVIYIYAPVLVLFLLWLFRFAWALVLWAVNALQSLLDVLSAIRAIELARLASLEQEPWVEEMNLKRDRQMRHVLYHDSVFKGMYPVHPGDTQRFYNPFQAGDYQRMMAMRPPGSGFPQLPYTDYDTSGLPRDQAVEATVRSNMYSQVPLPVPIEQRIGADVEQRGGQALAERAPITERGGMALQLFIDSLERGAKLFGRASKEPTTVHHVYAHEARWHPIIHSAHYSATWIAARISEAAHQRAQYARRRPPLMSYQRGLFGWQ